MEPPIQERVEPESDEFVVTNSSLIIGEQAGAQLVSIDISMSNFADLANALAARSIETITAEDAQRLRDWADDVHLSAYTLRQQLGADLNLSSPSIDGTSST